MKHVSPSQMLAGITALLNTLPPAPFNGAVRLVVAQDVYQRLRSSGEIIERMGTAYLGSVMLERSAHTPAGCMMGFDRNGNLVWSNRFDAGQARRAA